MTQNVKENLILILIDVAYWIMIKLPLHFERAHHHHIDCWLLDTTFSAQFWWVRTYVPKVQMISKEGNSQGRFKTNVFVKFSTTNNISKLRSNFRLEHQCFSSFKSVSIQVMWPAITFESCSYKASPLPVDSMVIFLISVRKFVIFEIWPPLLELLVTLHADIVQHQTRCQNLRHYLILPKVLVLFKVYIIEVSRSDPSSFSDTDISLLIFTSALHSLTLIPGYLFQ